MPSGSRVRANNVYGTVSDNPLLVGAVSFTSLGLSLLPAISGQHAVIVFDPKRVFGEPEIVVVTSHLAMGTTATIVRGQYGTVAREHPQGTAWAHVPVGPDDYITVATSGARPTNPYEGQLIYETDTDYFNGWDGAAWENGFKLGQWVAYTPTLGQGATTDIAKTVQYSRYVKVGRTVIWQWRIAITGTGTASSSISLTLPVAPASSADTVRPCVGSSVFFNSSANTFHPNLPTLAINGSTTLLLFTPAEITVGLGSQFLGLSSMTEAVANNDTFGGFAIYEGAS